MRVSVSFDPDLNAYVFDLAGEADLPRFLDALGVVYREHEPSKPLNLIFRDEGLTHFLSSGDAMTLMGFARKHRPPCTGRTALVGRSDLSFGTFRMAEGLGGDFSDHIQVFRSTEEAECWITAEESSSDVA